MNARVVVRAGNSESPSLQMDEDSEPIPTKKSGFGSALLASISSEVVSMVTEKPKPISLIPQAQKPSQCLDDGRILVYQVQPRRVGDVAENPYVVIKVQRYVQITRDEADEQGDVVVVQHEDMIPQYYVLKWFELGGRDIRLIRETKQDRGSCCFRIAPDEILLPKEVDRFARFISYIQAYDTQHEERRIFVAPEALPSAIQEIFERAYPTPEYRAPPKIAVTKHAATYLCISAFATP